MPSRPYRHLPTAMFATRVEQIADLLDQLTGRGNVCGRPVRLITGHGLVPPHPTPNRGGPYCPGGAQLPPFPHAVS